MSSYDPADRMAAQMRVREYLKTVLDERDQGEGDDLLTRVAAWRRNPRFQSEEEVLSMATLLFAGGLDTVASQLSYIHHHLARHPEQTRPPREEPEIILSVRASFLRRSDLSHTWRPQTRPFDYKVKP